MLASTAKFVLNQLGVAAPVAEDATDENAAVVAAVEAELGADWPKQVEPRFDERKAILFDDRWASAREDLARAYYNNDESALNGSFIGLGETIADEAAWYADKSDSADLKAAFKRVADEAVQNASESAETSRFAGDIAVVTGVAPNSIAAQVVNGLLAGGATVVATSHSFKPSVKAWAKQTYREHAAGDAKLWLFLRTSRVTVTWTRWSLGLAMCRRRLPVRPPRFSSLLTSRACSSRSRLRRCMATAAPHIHALFAACATA